MTLTCYHESCPKLFEYECLEAGHLRSQADTTMRPIKQPFTKAGLAAVIANFEKEKSDKCGTEDVALMLAIDYATNIMNQMAE